MPKRVLTIQEAERLIATCDARTVIDLRDRALIIVGLETGMRPMSLLAMRLEAIHYKRGCSIVSVPIKGSSDALYRVPLSDTAIAALEPWRAWLRGKQVTTATTGPVFCGLVRGISRGGKLSYEPTSVALSTEALGKIITRRAKRANLRDVNPSAFRDTFIAWRVEAGIAPYEIAAVIGRKINYGFEDHAGAAVLGDGARQTTPAWLAKLVRRG